MTLEKQLIRKTYYKTFLPEESEHPIRVLGEAFLEEQKKDLYDVSFIRFAQGEVYYHHKDFEAAIFKWENINGELEGWARKNVGDAYYESGLLDVAEGIYKSIETDAETLRAEVAFQLFSLYEEQQKFDSADEVIKKAVAENPAYPNLTEVARTFYEEQHDWSSALDLAIGESIRTESTKWFDVLIHYVSEGHIQAQTPTYFHDVLAVFHNISEDRFVELIVALWEHYKQTSSYIEWLEEINSLLIELDIQASAVWDRVSNLFDETYRGLIAGTYFIRQLEELVPPLLTNWLKVTQPVKALFASSAVWAWNELFPSTLAANTVTEAENTIFRSTTSIDGLSYSIDLFEAVIQWTKVVKVDVGYKLKWWANQMVDLNTHNVLVAGSVRSGKSTFINSLLQEPLLSGSPAPVVVMNDDHIEVSEITEDHVEVGTELSGLQTITSRAREVKNALIEVRLPNQFLKGQHYAFIDTPGLNSNAKERNDLGEFAPLSDGMLFVLDANTPFTPQERDRLLRLKEQVPELSIHFLLNKMDAIQDAEEAATLVDHTESAIQEHFPNAKVFPYSSKYAVDDQVNDLTEFLQSSYGFTTRNLEEERAMKLLQVVRNTLTYLLRKRVEVENELIDSISWNEDMVVRLNGFINSLSDVEEEKISIISGSYRSIKEEIKDEVQAHIPELLRGCSDLITEDSDFRNLHVELNEKMNERIQEYLQLDVLPKFRQLVQNWIEKSNEEFSSSQVYLDEMSETFNGIYEGKTLKLACDFKVLDDWSRDVHRMTSRVQIEEENIWLRFKPSQFMLKSAGKLFGAFSQNNQLLHNQYQRYVENEDYTDVTNSIVRKFFLQFDLFEKGLDVDIKIFFRGPFQVLQETVDQTEVEINQSKEQLDDMKANPELYQDPLKLFELKLRQYELMIRAQ